MKRLRKASVVVVLVLVAAELLARVKMSYNTGKPSYLLAPFLMKRITTAGGTEREPSSDPRNGYYKRRPGVQDHFTINRLGFRGPDFDPVRKSAATRIICAGDSNVIGLDVKDDETWPAVLSRLLNQRVPSGFEVINAGFNGFTSSHYLNLIRAELLNYSPDILIVYGGVNDLHDDPKLGARRGGDLRKSLHDLLYYRSILYTLTLEKFSLMRSQSPVPMTVFENTHYLELFANNTGAIIDLCRKKNVRLVFVRETINADPVQTSRMDQEMAVLKTLCARQHVEYLDPTTAFREAQQAGVRVFSDEIHLGVAGFAILADRVAGYLTAR
jgi:lysophospholipase L1-like esterase